MLAKSQTRSYGTLASRLAAPSGLKRSSMKAMKSTMPSVCCQLFAEMLPSLHGLGGIEFGSPTLRGDMLWRPRKLVVCCHSSEVCLSLLCHATSHNRNQEPPHDVGTHDKDLSSEKAPDNETDATPQTGSWNIPHLPPVLFVLCICVHARLRTQQVDGMSCCVT